MKSSRHLPRTDSSSFSNPTEIESPIMERPGYSEGDLGRIEEILLGKYINSTQDQLAQLQDYIEKIMSSLASAYQRQFNELNSKLDEKYAAFDHSLKTLDAENKKQFGQSNNIQNDLAEKLQTLSGNSDQLKLQLKSDIDSSNEALTSRINATHEDMTQRLNAAIDSLGNQKLDRDSLSTLLSDVAKQLTEHSTASLSDTKDSNKL